MSLYDCDTPVCTPAEWDHHDVKVLQLVGTRIRPCVLGIFLCLLAHFDAHLAYL